MNKIGLLLAISTVTGCNSLGTFTHQAGVDEPHAVIAVAEYIPYSAHSGGIKVEAIDGIQLPGRPGKSQSFRVRPGRHVITYSDTATWETTPFDEMNPAEKVMAAGGVTVGNLVDIFSLNPGSGEWEAIKKRPVYSAPTREIETVAGKRYYLLRHEVYESEITNHSPAPLSASRPSSP